MADTFTAVDLSRLPAPEVVEQLDFDTIYNAMLSKLQELLPDFDATVESDPIVKVLEVAAYRELLIRQQFNDGAHALMLAYAIGADLDHIAATYYGVTRLVVTPADTQTGAAAVLESDDDLRRRLTLAPESYSVAGPEGAYIFHALSADARVVDASVDSPSPGEVLVTLLTREADGSAPPDLVAAVYAYLSADTRRPLTDMVTVQSAEIVPYTIAATLKFRTGPDQAVVLLAAEQRLDDYVDRSRRLGFDINRSSIIAALTVEGIENVLLDQPAADLVLGLGQASHCTSIALTNGGVGG